VRRTSRKGRHKARIAWTWQLLPELAIPRIYCWKDADASRPASCFWTNACNIASDTCESRLTGPSYVVLGVGPRHRYSACSFRTSVTNRDSHRQHPGSVLPPRRSRWKRQLGALACLTASLFCMGHLVPVEPIRRRAFGRSTDHGANDPISMSYGNPSRYHQILLRTWHATRLDRAIK
jgi:hypothetical protein